MDVIYSAISRRHDMTKICSHFTFLQFVSKKWDPTDLLWCKKRYRHQQGDPTDLLWCKKRDRYQQGGPTDLLDI